MLCVKLETPARRDCLHNEAIKLCAKNMKLASNEFPSRNSGDVSLYLRTILPYRGGTFQGTCRIVRSYQEFFVGLDAHVIVTDVLRLTKYMKPFCFRTSPG